MWMKSCAELGVVFLMFIIGLELNPAKLWQLRRSILASAPRKVMLSAVVLAGLLMLLHSPGRRQWLGALVWRVIDRDGAAVDA